jgi:hypothetical protein
LVTVGRSERVAVGARDLVESKCEIANMTIATTTLARVTSFIDRDMLGIVLMERTAFVK